ncbi:hypothetical protein [Vibrio panuliri]|uniref:Uncharacterized protein n=1 Tax=Vibrio panuliri TaxID=1381081 RepID=A0ABX3F6J0_9VIBR|nr:hypothetical protein [Vibrio panuliri]KAB1454210.1 hypothetical protein F7O85_15075 [Vibrio panuliri]OLQ84658.1 hypothetical protein BIY20_17430 [Vibrio panuliri]
MSFEVPKWLTDVALVGAIFTAGGIYFSTNDRIQQLETEVAALKTASAVQEKAISIHHGRDWSDRLDQLMKVEDLKGSLTSTEAALSEHYKTNAGKIETNDIWLSSVRSWAEQQDALIRSQTLDKFRAIAVYSQQKSGNAFEVMINKQHVKGSFYKKGDRVLIENPAPPGFQVEASVKGFLDDPASSNVLVQMNEGLLSELGLTTKLGRYELYITNNADILRWKSLEDIYLDTAE